MTTYNLIDGQLAEAEQPEAAAVTVDDLEGMDVETLAAEEQQECEGWKLADDAAADWAIRKIAAERAELTRIKELADAEIARIKEKVAAAERRYENNTSYLTHKLAEYFEKVPHKKTKTKHSYRLLSGTLTKKIGGVAMKQDDAKLVEYLKASGNEDMIKIEEKPKWGEFKKRLEIMGGQVVDTETGEIVEGVTIEQKPDTFSVDL